MVLIKIKEKKMLKKMLSSLFVLLLLILTSCGGDKGVTITIEPDGNNMSYATTSFTVKANQEVTLVMNNTATMEMMKHNIVILDDESKINEIGMQAVTAPGYLPEHSAIIAATPMANAGETTQVVFVAPEKGSYPFICTFPGHYGMMRGTMIVK